MSRDWSYDKRYLWRFFEVNEIERTQPEGRSGGRLDINFPFANDGERKRAWLHDSLLWTIEMIEAGEIKLAFRGFIQATEYAGELYPGRGGTNASDLLISLRNYFEGVFEQTAESNQQLAEIIADAREGQGLDVFLFHVSSTLGPRVVATPSGIVRARTVEQAAALVREYVSRFYDLETTFEFRLFRPVRVNGVLTSTIHTPIYEGD